MSDDPEAAAVDPFEIWWKLYPGTRKYGKKKCRPKFEAYTIDVQRQIWLHTKRMVDHPNVWNDPQFIPAPEVYLNQERWESQVPPVDAPTERPLTIESSVDKQQELQGLEKLQKHAKDPKLQAQIDKLKSEMGATDHVKGF